MSGTSLHAEWLSLLDVSGPFLALPILNEALPQGVAGLDTDKRKIVRQAYAEWCEAFETEDDDRGRIHDAWIDLVIKDVLSYRDAESSLLKHGTAIPEIWKYTNPEHGITLAPDCVLTDAQGKPILLIVKYPHETRLDEPAQLDRWATNPIERMVELCRATGIRLGLLTNGERWAVVDATLGVTSVASWYARYWSQEPITLQAFVDLLGVRRFFSGTTSDLPALLDKSLSLQDEVTDALGEQVRRAVEVLVQSLDRADQDRNRELLKDVSPGELYEAGLTIMMRIVFLLSAEERGLLLMGDETYEANYAVSTLRIQLRNEAEEILERRWDAWSRLLSLFRAIFAGIEHDALRLPALGGSLFDPDRFPFLEGRAKGSNWKTDAAVPLPIDNRTVLLLLEAVQLFQGRALSYLALDVEQIGYVYEGLLERTVVRAPEVTLDLAATKNATNPWVTLSELDDAAAKGDAAVQKLLEERTESSPGRIKNALAGEVDEGSSAKLLAACQADQDLRDRVAPYFHLLRTDSWGYPLVYPKGTFMVASGSDRRETGTHYTPKSFTESIVKTTLEPLVYEGPAQGAERADWQLKKAADLLDLKVCDPAMGSGAFLVQVCRYLSERLVEAWCAAEVAGQAVSADGEVLEHIGGSEPMSTNPDERQTNARRLIAERCLYGVDMNPLAVELAKLSIWLVTLAKGRPFGFLDHNLRSGDSLLGITSLDQLVYLDLKPGPNGSKRLFTTTIDEAIEAAVHLRSELRARPIRDIHDVEVMKHLDDESRNRLKIPMIAADALIGSYLAYGATSYEHSNLLPVRVGHILSGDAEQINEAADRTLSELDAGLPDGKKSRRPFHWCLEFPEVFLARGGFDALVGNPPFLGNRMISGAFGPPYKDFLSNNLGLTPKPATADIVVFFFLRALSLVPSNGYFGMLARRSIAEGRNREIGLDKMIAHGATIFFANTNMEWPGKASVIVHQIHFAKSRWSGVVLLDGRTVEEITAYLDATTSSAPGKLIENEDRMFQGTILNGEGFKITEEIATKLLTEHEDYSRIVFPFIGGSEVNSSADPIPSCWVINFWDWPEEEAARFHRAFSIVEEHVKPGRTRKKANGEYHLRSPLPERWWHYSDKRPALYRALGRGAEFVTESRKQDEPCASLARVMVIARGVTKYPAFTFVKNDFVFSEKLYVFADERFSTFAALTSDIHSVWAWKQKTSMGADLYSLSYTHGIFETFPFPAELLAHGDSDLEELGHAFFEKRQSYMRRNNQGLTRFYNEFHNVEANNSELLSLRNDQTKINEALADRYEWSDLDVECRFVEAGYLPEGNNFRWSVTEEARLSILKKLGELNSRRRRLQVADDVEIPQIPSLAFELQMPVAPSANRRRVRKAKK
ncbi:Eco57I restriction-modification methylase domain-containing protein [Bradyrhizobium sp. CCBAU 21360]|uniref:Eco57I restriction-modification methylase domain-containing protein n=1 Tax=Bradyrhizobium sp. CCBAU 21360 TaxID=1325081 RepID=UPI00230672BE|nr:type IIL restriction-modification enzyme MmeI [Bradyrhizobium sp. CCBAU 21360]